MYDMNTYIWFIRFFFIVLFTSLMCDLFQPNQSNSNHMCCAPTGLPQYYNFCSFLLNIDHGRMQLDKMYNTCTNYGNVRLLLIL